jgi:dipeptide/tripeptide permease
MSTTRKVLLAGGFALATLGMLYGLHYAVLVEHQALNRMGGSLSQAFVHAAERNTAEANGALDTYASTKYDYVRQVDLHSHWIGLAMVLMVLGVAFDNLAFSERARTWVAVALLTGSFLFPLGVILQTVSHGAVLGSALAIFGSATVTVALAAVVWGFWR